MDAVMPADARVREELAALCLQLLAESGAGRDLAGVAEGEALERLAKVLADPRSDGTRSISAREVQDV